MGVPDDISPDDIPEEQKELAGLLAVAFYNLGVEQEALDRPEEGLESVGRGLALARKFCGQPMSQAMETRKSTLAERVEVLRVDRAAKEAAAAADEAAAEQRAAEMGTQRKFHAPKPPQSSMPNMGGTGSARGKRKSKRRTPRAGPAMARSMPLQPEVPFAQRLGTPPMQISGPGLTDAELRIVKAYKGLQDVRAEPGRPPRASLL
eukprot:COSAG04_NODE_9430_length_865_cov_1.071802_1_plen_205_part_10